MTVVAENVIVTHPFKAEYPDELSIEKGEIVQLVSSINEDWFFGKSERLMAQGIFPKACIQLGDDPNTLSDICNHISKSTTSEISIARSTSSRRKFQFQIQSKETEKLEVSSYETELKQEEDTSSGSEEEDVIKEPEIPDPERFRRLSIGRKPNQYLIETSDRNVLVELNSDILSFKTSAGTHYFNVCDVNTNPFDKNLIELLTPTNRYICKATESLLDLQKHLNSSGEPPSLTSLLNSEKVIELKSIEGNNQCADCGESNPSWVSSNLGVLLCIECSGIHRSLGVHVSRVKSLLLDLWTIQGYEFLKAMGNKRLNSFLEAELKNKEGFNFQSHTERENFIKLKYVELFFIDNAAKSISNPYFSFLKSRLADPTEDHSAKLAEAILEYNVPLIAFYLGNGIRNEQSVLDQVKKKNWVAMERFLSSWGVKDVTANGTYSAFKSQIAAPSNLASRAYPFTGFVYKSDPKGRRYQRRYFALNESGLSYSKKPNDISVLGSISSEEILSIKIIDSENKDEKQEQASTGRYYFDIITLNRTFHCFVDCEYIRDYWVSAFEWNKRMVEWRKKSDYIESIKDFCEVEVNQQVLNEGKSLIGVIKGEELVLFRDKTFLIALQLDKLQIAEEKLTSFTCVYDSEAELCLKFKSKDDKRSYMSLIKRDEVQSDSLEINKFRNQLPVFLKTLDWLLANSTGFPSCYSEQASVERAVSDEDVLYSTDYNEVALYVCRFVSLYMHFMDKSEKDRVVQHLNEMIVKNTTQLSRVALLDLTYNVADRFTKLITQKDQTSPVPNDYFLKGLLSKDQKIEVSVLIYIEKRKEPVKMKISVPENFNVAQLKSALISNHLDSTIEWSSYYFTLLMNVDSKEEGLEPDSQYERFLHPEEQVKQIFPLEGKKHLEFKFFNVNVTKLKQFHSLKNSNYEGWLYKEGKKIKSWKKRFFVLHANTLLYYKEPSSASPLGSFLNIDRKKIWMVRNYSRTYNPFLLCLFDEQKSVFRYLCAENEIELLSWIFQLTQISS